MRRCRTPALALILVPLTGAWGCSGPHPGHAPAQDLAGSATPALKVPRSLGEPIVPGHALLELASPIFSGLAQQQAQTAGTAPAAAPVYLIGGVQVQPIRPLFSGGPGSPDSGPPLWLVDTGATDSAATWSDISRLAADPRISRAEPDRIRKKTSVPNDTLYPLQWGPKVINVESAWDQVTGSDQVTVAILDTGIIEDHPDLKARLVAGYDFISDVDNAGDGDGRDPDPHDEGAPDDSSSGLHGTHVTGIIGAGANNGRGIAGIDWQCRLMPVRVLGINGGTGADSDISDALLWIAGQPVGTMTRLSRAVDVANLSFGGLGISFTVQRAVNAATAQGVVVVAAAGNGSDDTTLYSPGGLDRVVSVGAIDQSMGRADYSNYGPRVDLVAPGGGDLPFTDDAGVNIIGVLSTFRVFGYPDPDQTDQASYDTKSGTSQATPHVTGAVALARSIYGLRQLSMASLLRQSAHRTDPCDRDPDRGCGAGLLDVARLLDLVRLQSQCACHGDLLCQDGACVDPGSPHPSIFADPVVHGGCQVSRAAPADAGGPALALLSCAALARLVRRLRRRFDNK